MVPTSKLIAAALAISAVSTALPAERHPRLLITADELPRLRHRCGVERDPAVTADWGPYASQGAAYQKLRDSFAEPVIDVPLPGELIAAAFVTVLERGQPFRTGASRVVREALGNPDWVSTDILELALAYEWTLDDLPEDVRQDFLIAARERMPRLALSDSPLEPRRFRERLFALIIALGVDEIDDPSPSWRAERREVLDAAREYLSLAFPIYLRWRGLSPTSPSAGPQEELLTALTVELSRHVLGHETWPEHRNGVGRWLEHYVFGTLEHPALRHNFIRDDGGDAPLTPAPRWTELMPLTAALIAARTGDPAAATIARRVAELGAGTREAEFWSWAPLAFAIPTDVELKSLPLARNFGGSVVFRTSGGQDATAIWIDAAQPYLRNRQHLDAGHFIIYRGGRLAVSGSEDIALEAIPSKRGEQRLGPERTPFDFEDYTIATIAHNAVVCWDPAFVTKCDDRNFLPAGGQRCVASTCVDFKMPLEKQGRLTGRQLAYGQTEHAAYLALELAPAYDDRVVKRYTRQFVFCLDRVLVIVDDVELTSGRSPPTWVLNIPARPQADGHGLPAEKRIAGANDEGGIWRIDDARWLRWTDRDGSLWMTSLAPTSRRLRVVGGPAKSLAIPEGEFAGRTYVGGDPNGFERLIIPGERRGTANAWYRLGAPALLGPLFARTPYWGRIEVEPTGLNACTRFVTVLATDRPDAEHAPSAEAQVEDGRLRLVVTTERETAELDLLEDLKAGGTLRVRGRSPFEWSIPTTVEPDPPLVRPATQPARD